MTVMRERESKRDRSSCILHFHGVQGSGRFFLFAADLQRPCLQHLVFNIVRRMPSNIYIHGDTIESLLWAQHPPSKR